MEVHDPRNLWDEYIPLVAKQPVDEPAQQLAHRPTLVIGLGGTGTKVLQKLYRMVQSHFGQERSGAFQFLVLDTDAQRVEDRDEALGPEIFVNLAQPYIRASSIVDRMEEFPGLREELEAWWPHRPAETPGRGEQPLPHVDQGAVQHDPQPAGQNRRKGRPFRPGNIISGAHAVRSVGRFALWHQGRNVTNLFERRWGRAVELSGDYTGVVNRTISGKVYIVCSLAGGTGSGMFLDTAYILRRLMSRSAMPIFFTGILLMDATPFREFAGSAPVIDRMNANIYAALTELNHFMNPDPLPGAHYSFTYNGGLRIESRDKPFDVCNLVGVTNEHGRQLTDLNAICNMVAEAIFLEIASPLGDTGRSVLDNVEELENTVEFPLGNERFVNIPTAFSSFAVASLNYPRERIANYVAFSLVHDHMDQLSRHVSRESQRAELANLPRELVGMLLEPLRDEPALLQPDAFAVDPVVDPAGVRRRTDELLRQAEERHPEWIKRTKEHARRVVAEQCVQPGGLAHTPAVLQQIVELLERAVREGRSRTNTTAQTAQDILRQIEEAAEEYSAVLNQRRPQAEQLDDLRDQGQELVNSLHQQLVYRVVSEDQTAILQELIPLIDGWRDALQMAFEQWTEHEAQRVQRAMNDVRRQRLTRSYSLGLNALTAGGFAYLTEQMTRQADHRLMVEIVDQWLNEVPFLRQDSAALSLGKWMFEIVLGLILEREEFRDWDLFQAVYEAELKPQNPQTKLEDAIDSALKRLQEYGVPFWTIDDSLWSGSDQIAHINLLGYHQTQERDGQSALWVQRATQILGRAHPVRHNVRDKLVLLQTKHGLPAYVITGSVLGQREAYERAMERWQQGQGRPVHLQDDWSVHENITPLDPTPSRRDGSST